MNVLLVYLHLCHRPQPQLRATSAIATLAGKAWTVTRTPTNAQAIPVKTEEPAPTARTDSRVLARPSGPARSARTHSKVWIGKQEQATCAYEVFSACGIFWDKKRRNAPFRWRLCSRVCSLSSSSSAILTFLYAFQSVEVTWPALRAPSATPTLQVAMNTIISSAVPGWSELTQTRSVALWLTLKVKGRNENQSIDSSGCDKC